MDSINIFKTLPPMGGSRRGAIIFDFGGILVDLDKDRCVNAFNKINAGEISRYVDFCIQEDLFHELEIGAISVEEFCDEVRRKAPGCQASNEEIIHAWAILLVDVPKRRLEKLLELKQNYRLFLLSNTNEIHWAMAENDFFRQIPGLCVDDYFEKKYLSCRLHMIKPSPEIFQMVLEENGLDPEETIFIDDSEKNCRAAEALGIKGICVPNADMIDSITEIR